MSHDRFAAVRAAVPEYPEWGLERRDPWLKRTLSHVPWYNMHSSDDRKDLQAGLVEVTRGLMLAIVEPLLSINDVDAWLEKLNPFGFERSTVFKAFGQVYMLLGKLGKGMSINMPQDLPEDKLDFGAGDPILRAAREVQGQFAEAYWNLNGAVLRRKAQEKWAKAQVQRPNWFASSTRWLK